MARISLDAVKWLDDWRATLNTEKINWKLSLSQTAKIVQIKAKRMVALAHDILCKPFGIVNKGVSALTQSSTEVGNWEDTCDEMSQLETSYTSIDTKSQQYFLSAVRFRHSIINITNFALSRRLFRLFDAANTSQNDFDNTSSSNMDEWLSNRLKLISGNMSPDDIYVRPQHIDDLTLIARDVMCRADEKWRSLLQSLTDKSRFDFNYIGACKTITAWKRRYDENIELAQTLSEDEGETSEAIRSASRQFDSQICSFVFQLLVDLHFSGIVIDL